MVQWTRLTEVLTGLMLLRDWPVVIFFNLVKLLLSLLWTFLADVWKSLRVSVGLKRCLFASIPHSSSLDILPLGEFEPALQCSLALVYWA